jgi:hypothetical protein
MSTLLLDPFVVEGGTDEFISMHMKGTDKLVLFVHVAFAPAAGAVGCTLTLTNGWGPRAPEIPHPPEQPIPLVHGLSGNELTGVTWESEGIQYNMPAIVADEQSLTIEVDVKQIGDYLRMEIDNADANDGTVTVKALTS